MEQLTRNNLEKVQKVLGDETRKVKSYGIASAVTSVAAPVVMSALTVPNELIVTSIIGASGIGITLKFLYNKLKLESTEDHVSQISKRLETDKDFENAFNEKMNKEDETITSGIFKYLI